MNVHLSQESHRFIAAAVASGRYVSEDAVVEDALLRMRQQEQPAPAEEAGAESGHASAGTQKPLWEVITEIARRVPDEEWAKIPSDASYQLDHYLYGAPKKPAP
jgi:putative addiction module CopG family antidote